MKKALVCGAGGFIGWHLVKRLKEEGFWVHGVDARQSRYKKTYADNFTIQNLGDLDSCKSLFLNTKYDEVYQLAADMGGAGFVFTGDNDARIMHNSAVINLNMVECCKLYKVGKVFYSSSACVYPHPNIDSLDYNESAAYPAQPVNEYGWEKLFSERLYLAYHRNYDLGVRIARFHTIFGPYSTWTGGREKAVAAICRKIAMAPSGGTVEIWGDGKQTRSFLYIDDCIEGIRRLVQSDFIGPVNIGSKEMVSIDTLVSYIAQIAKKTIHIKHIDGPLGVKGRISDNSLIKEKLGWEPTYDLRLGLSKIYSWIKEQVDNEPKC